VEHPIYQNLTGWPKNKDSSFKKEKSQLNTDINTDGVQILAIQWLQMCSPRRWKKGGQMDTEVYVNTAVFVAVFIWAPVLE